MEEPVLEVTSSPNRRSNRANKSKAWSSRLDDR